MSWLRAAERLMGKIKLVVGLGRLGWVIDSGDVQRVQGVFLAGGETHDNMPRAQDYGVCSWPPSPMPVLALFPAGDRSAGLVVAVIDNKHRPALEEGDSALYDHRGQGLHFHPGGARLVVKGKLEVWADDIEEHAAVSRLVSVGGYADKLTHVSEGNLVAETWHDGALVTPDPDHGYKLPEVVPDV